MKCSCGGTYEEKIKELQGISCNVLICNSCNEIVFTLEQFRTYNRLKQNKDEV